MVNSDRSTEIERYDSFQIRSTKSKYDQLYHTFRFLPVNKEDIVTSGSEQEVKAGDKRKHETRDNDRSEGVQIQR